MSLRLGINGFGRIGRLVLRAAVANPNGKVLSVNDPFVTPDYARYLLQYDTAHGRFPGTVEAIKDGLLVNGQKIKLYHERDPLEIPWYKEKVDIVCESTGVFLDQESGCKHL